MSRAEANTCYVYSQCHNGEISYGFREVGEVGEDRFMDETYTTRKINWQTLFDGAEELEPDINNEEQRVWVTLPSGVRVGLVTEAEREERKKRRVSPHFMKNLDL